MTPEERNEMVEENMGLATHFAKRFTASKMEFDDLLQEAYLGLIDAADKFDPKRGIKFSTYARWHILKRAMQAIHNTNEIVRTPRRRPSHICVRLKPEHEESLTYEDPDVGAQIDEDEMVEAVRAQIKHLPSREGIVIRLRYGINTEAMTLRDVGRILGVTPERVRQIQNDAEEKLRALLAESAILRDHGADRPGT